MKKNRFALQTFFPAIVTLVLILSIVSCTAATPTPTTTSPVTPPKPTGPQVGGILTLADLQPAAGSAFPPTTVNTYLTRQMAPVMETLLRTDDTSKLIPWLATAYKEDAVAKTITLTIRKGVKFHDGTDFNVDAVKWNLDQSKTYKQQGTENISSVTIIDDSTVRINLTAWDSTTTSHLSRFMGMMVSPAAFNKNGKEWAEKNPVGTGPFQFVSWQQDVKIVLKKFDNYWQKGKPYLDGIEIVNIPDTMTRLLSFKAGEQDIMVTNDPQPIADLEKSGYVISRKIPGFAALSLIYDSANPKSPFADVRVRQAATYAIDRDAIIKGVYFGEAEAENQWGYKAHWGYNPSVVGYPYNPAKAKQLLADAGYPDGFKTKFIFLAMSAKQFTACQNFLKAVGINAETDQMQIPRFDTYIGAGATWEGILQSPTSSNEDPAASLRERWGNNGKQFVSMQYPDDFLKALQNAIAASDFDSKQKAVWEAQKLMIDKYCMITPLFAQNNLAVHQSYIHNDNFTGNIRWTPEDAWKDKK